MTRYDSKLVIICIIMMNVQVDKLWQLYSALIVTAMAPSFEEHHLPIVDNWTMLARKFADLFTDVYTPEGVTPYMHVFVYHLQYFLKTAGPIELWANYDIEGWHKINKSTTKHMTSGFGGRNKVACNLTIEELSAGARLKEYYQRHPNRQLPIKKLDVRICR